MTAQEKSVPKQISGVLSTLVKTSFAFLSAYALRDAINETILQFIRKKDRLMYTYLYAVVVITMGVIVTVLLG